DRGTKSITFIASSDGGVEIEKTAEENPDAIKTLHVNYVQGLQPYQCREIGFKLGLNAKQVNQLSKIMMGLYKLFNEKDLALVELNPLAILTNGDLAVLDGKVNSDDNASFRHADLVAMRDKAQEDETEVLASEHDLNYVTMDGNIGCMVNGAGLAMATMDVIKLSGGEPANFLDVGGGATKERVTTAFKLILSSDKVKAIFVNIFGGIVRCDMIAEGIIAAVKDVGVKVPVIVRLEGTNVEAGKKLLAESGLAILPADDINDGAKKAVAAVAAA
ncbi:MAG TPA: ADP-forming succinate--CoA ligase subunit beta, partial [Pseudoxanthomonas sp.]|nr:ADP-forming succinate--CoA ligase subunit beta [Pseudoxanthomonas sp.]